MIPSEMQRTSKDSAKPSTDPLLPSNTEDTEELKDSPGPQGWPSHPQTLRESSDSLTLRILPHLAILLIPACFIVLGVLLFRLGGKEQSAHGDRLLSVAGLAASIWPIAFAVVIGAFLRSLALYKAERGTYLGMLELVLTSQTLGNALKAIFTLRFLGRWSLFLLCLWTLSPAGGQGVLRSVSTKRDVVTNTIRMLYHPPVNLTAAMDDQYWNTAEYLPLSWDYLDQTQSQLMFDAAISSAYAPLHLIDVNETDPYNPINYLGGMEEAMKVSERDLWGNARIPQLELLTGYNAEDPYAWINVSDSKPPTYESLVGMKIHGLPKGALTNTTVQVEAAYATFNCSPWVNLTEWLWEHPRGLVYANNTNETYLFYSPDRMTNVFLDILDPGEFDRDPGDPPSYPDFGTTMVVGTTNNGYSWAWSDDPDEDDLEAAYRNYVTVCAVGTTHLDLEVSCSRTTAAGDTSCAATRARHSPAWPPAPHANIFNSGDPAKWWQYYGYIPSLLKFAGDVSPADASTVTYANGTKSVAVPFPGVSTTFADFLTNIGLTTSCAAYTNAYLDQLPLDVLNARLGYLVNSYWRLNLNGAGGMGIDGADKYTLKARSSPYFVNATGEARALREPPTYHVHGAYFALYGVAAAAMLGCALGTIVLRCVVRAPDVFAGVSGLTRFSPWVDVPPGGTAMDAGVRARLLKDRWVRVQDVRPEGEVGVIAFSDRRDLRVFRLEWERRYE